MDSNSNESSKMDVEVPSFTIEGFLLSALVDFEEINSKGEKKVEQVKKYASLLVDAELAGEKTLNELDESTLRELGLPLGHARAISKAAQSFGKKVEGIKESVETVMQRVLQSVKKIDSTNGVCNIPLQERSDQLRDVVTHVAGNLHRIVQPKQQISNTGKTDLLIPTFAGGSGIGKTTLAYESAQELFRKWKQIAPKQYQDAKLLYLMIDFSNGGKLLFIEKDLHPSLIMGLRLAYAYFLQGKYKANFPEFLQACGTSLESFTIASVMEAIRKGLQLTNQDDLFVVLHIDEVQFIFDYEREYEWESKRLGPLVERNKLDLNNKLEQKKELEKLQESPEKSAKLEMLNKELEKLKKCQLELKGLFKLLIYEICTFFTVGKSTIQTFISGTAHRKVMESKEPTMYTFQFIDTPLLSLGAVFKLIEYYATQFGANPWEWKMQLPFLQLLGDMGGLPRAISYLLEECFGKNFSRGQDFFQTICSKSFYPIFIRIADSITKKYGLEGFVLKNKAAALQVLNHAIRNISVTRDVVLGNVVIEQMEQDGHIFLHRVGTDYYFRMPFLFIFIYDQYLHIIPRELAEVAFNHDNKVMWQDWESFNAIFQVFMNNFLIYEKGKIDLSLGEFYYKADGHDDTKNLFVKLDLLEVAPVVHRFPSKTQLVVHKDTGKVIDWATCRHLLLNGKSAEFGDTVLILVAEKQTAQKYFGRQVNMIIVSGQQKWDYNSEDFTLEQARNEHKKTQETAEREDLPKSCGLITVIFTTQRLPKEKIQSIPKDILIIHQDNFKDYYGPFAARAAFSIAHSLNPNFADIQHLQVLEGIGEETAKAIALERQKRPFTNVDDLCNRVKRAKKDKFTRQLTFFPFTSKRLLLPFEGYTRQKEEKV